MQFSLSVREDHVCIISGLTSVNRKCKTKKPSKRNVQVNINNYCNNSAVLHTFENTHTCSLSLYNDKKKVTNKNC